MGLISKATLLAAGYVLGARAGTARYEQIVDAARKVASRPELQPYLGALAGRTAPPACVPGHQATTVDTALATSTAPAAATMPPVPPVPPPVVPPLVEPTAPPPAPKVIVTGRGSSSRRRSS